MKEMEKASGYYKLRVIFSGFSQNEYGGIVEHLGRS